MNTGVSKFKYQHLSIKLNWLQFIRDEITVRTIIIIKKQLLIIRAILTVITTTIKYDSKINT